MSSDNLVIVYHQLVDQLCIIGHSSVLHNRMEMMRNVNEYAHTEDDSPQVITKLVLYPKQ